MVNWEICTRLPFWSNWTRTMSDDALFKQATTYPIISPLFLWWWNAHHPFCVSGWPCRYWVIFRWTRKRRSELSYSSQVRGCTMSSIITPLFRIYELDWLALLVTYCALRSWCGPTGIDNPESTPPSLSLSPLVDSPPTPLPFGSCFSLRWRCRSKVRTTHWSSQSNCLHIDIERPPFLSFLCVSVLYNPVRLSYCVELITSHP